MRRNLEIKVLLNSKLIITFNDNPGMYISVIPIGNEKFERINIKKKETDGKIETLSLRVNKLGSLISKDF